MSDDFMKEGKVKFFNVTKGFGFIIPQNDKKEIFFHVSNVVGDHPKEGDNVQYDEHDGKKGKEAIQVEII